MKRNALAVLVLGVALAAVFAAIGLRESTAPPTGLEGERVVPISLAVLSARPTTTVDRRQVPDLSAQKRSLVHFWGPSCAPCVKEAPLIEDLHQRSAATGLHVLTVTGEDTVDVRAFMAENGYTYPVLHDPSGKAHAAWRVRGIPASFLVDAQGTIVRVLNPPWTAADLDL